MTRILGYVRANALAFVALAIALGGTATASHLVVKASDIQANAVRANHIQQNSVRQKQAHRNNLSQWFGRGVLGARGSLPASGANVVGQADLPVLGHGDSFRIPMPRRARVRDVTARAENVASLPRPVEIRVLNGAQTVLTCAIPQGERTCHTGQATAAFDPIELLGLRVVAPPHPNATGAPIHFDVGYRISP